MENLRSLIKPPRFQGAATPASWPVRDLVGLPRFAYFGILSSFPSLTPLVFLSLSLIRTYTYTQSLSLSLLSFVSALLSFAFSLAPANPGTMEVYTGLRHDVDSISPTD